MTATGPAHARTEARTPKIDTNAARLKALDQQAEQSGVRAADLARRTAQMQKDLDGERQSLTRAAGDVRAGELALSSLESEQSALSAEYAHQAETLGQDRKALASLAAGLVRLARIPPGGLLAWTEAPIDAARAEMLLSSELTAARARAHESEVQLTRLDETGRALTAKQREALRAADVLRARQGALADLLAKRQMLYQRTESDRQTEKERADKIADEAKDLRDLVARIETQRREADQREAHERRKAHGKAAPAPTVGRFAGSAGLPIAGTIKIIFGQADGLGTTSRGVTIIARPGATVTAPASGKVRFAGQFRGYRQILILEHSGGYLSLIAGMSRIDAVVGAAVGAGEPVGAMDERPDSNPELYFELRRNNQPVDPEAVALPVDAKGKAR